MIKTTIKTFKQLTINQLYEILRLRASVFIVEQDCVYQDIDNKDQKALHYFITKNDKIIGYTRIFKAGDYFDQASIGRVVVHKNYRKENFGHMIMKQSIAVIKSQFNTSKITISAQLYLKNFYESHGFIQRGSSYLEDDIPHIKMIIQ